METEEAKEVIGEFGADQYGVDDPVWVTYKLYLDEGKTIEDIAEDAWLEPYQVRAWFKEIGLPRPATRKSIPERPKANGYNSLFEYFRKHDGESFTAMGDALNTNPDNVRSYYDRYIEFVNYNPDEHSIDHWDLSVQTP